jgi:4-hydroxythreonine-4-phosphate dehydrogenase
MTLPRIGVTLGDPGGVGPEVALNSLLHNPDIANAAWVLFGDSRLIGAEARRLGLSLSPVPWSPDAPPRGGLFLNDIPAPGAGSVRGRDDRANGEAAFRFFDAAVAAAREGRLEGLVTAPVSKTGWAMAGLPWRGHTEFLEHLYPGAVMSFWSGPLKVALLSHHLPLREALGKVRKEALLALLRTLDRSLSGLAGAPSEFLVAGLNPHAGEAGLLGIEEREEIGPAVAAACREGIRAAGPFPPDTVFLRARERKEAMVVAMYHDQGLIAFKLEAFASGVNVTLGLPFVRTSPDHGTAFDIAGRGGADPRSMTEALNLALRLASGRA